MSAEFLRKAAAKLRDTAAKASRGPWEDMSTDDDGAWPRYLIGAVGPGDDPQSAPEVIKVPESVDEEIVAREDIAWIALASPVLAEPLAAWLEEEARQWDLPPCDDPTGVCNRCEWRPGANDALTVARAILGDEPKDGGNRG